MQTPMAACTSQCRPALSQCLPDGYALETMKQLAANDVSIKCRGGSDGAAPCLLWCATSAPMLCVPSQVAINLHFSPGLREIAARVAGA